MPEMEESGFSIMNVTFIRNVRCFSCAVSKFTFVLLNNGVLILHQGSVVARLWNP